MRVRGRCIAVYPPRGFLEWESAVIQERRRRSLGEASCRNLAECLDHLCKRVVVSNGEVRSQLYVALDQEYIDQKMFDKLRNSALSLSRRLAKFIRYLERYPSNSRVRSSKQPE